jgi:hypothetical protein
MNKLTMLCAASILTGLSAIPAHATEFVAADNTIETTLCMAVANNRSLTLRKTMAKNRITHKVMNDALECNGHSVAEFVSIYTLNNTAGLLGIDVNAHTHIRDLSAQVNNDTTTLVVSGSK